MEGKVLSINNKEGHADWNYFSNAWKKERPEFPYSDYAFPLFMVTQMILVSIKDAQLDNCRGSVILEYPDWFCIGWNPFGIENEFFGMWLSKDYSVGNLKLEWIQGDNNVDSILIPWDKKGEDFSFLRTDLLRIASIINTFWKTQLRRQGKDVG